ncbi:MAG TPA: class I SAM-dependent methyltransferase [Candidatus Sulfotelmatobacter sp.]
MPLKEFGKNVVARTASNPVTWSLYKACGLISDAFGRIYGHARFSREGHERNETLRSLAPAMFPDLTVTAGPFRGLRYPAARSFGSVLIPKLLGSYESELHPVLEEMLAYQYSAIVDIGCAEGYYAVGLGMRLEQAEVYAFDADSRATRLCRDLATANGINGRLHLGGFCDEATLKSISLGRKALIISDCEGYEGLLFTNEVAAFLARHDLIIEAHDFIDIEISSRLRNNFAATHRVRSIKSTDDIEKAHTYQYSRLDGYDTETKRLILAERRPAIMEWLIMTSMAGD